MVTKTGAAETPSSRLAPLGVSKKLRIPHTRCRTVSGYFADAAQPAQAAGLSFEGNVAAGPPGACGT